MTEPAARDRMAARLCEVGLHLAFSAETPQWQDFWLRIADVALEQAREEVLGPFVALAEELESYVAARGTPATGTYDDGLNRAQAAAAADLRAALTEASGGGQ